MAALALSFALDFALVVVLIVAVALKNVIRVNYDLLVAKAVRVCYGILLFLVRRMQDHGLPRLLPCEGTCGPGLSLVPHAAVDKIFRCGEL